MWWIELTKTLEQSSFRLELMFSKKIVTSESSDALIWTWFDLLTCADVQIPRSNEIMALRGCRLHPRAGCKACGLWEVLMSRGRASEGNSHQRVLRRGCVWPRCLFLLSGRPCGPPSIYPSPTAFWHSCISQANGVARSWTWTSQTLS